VTCFQFCIKSYCIAVVTHVGW